MTNKQERYLVMSEAEFAYAIEAALRHERYKNAETREDADQAAAACRARPIPEYAVSLYCREYSKEAPQYIIRQWFEEIKK